MNFVNVVVLMIPVNGVQKEVLSIVDSLNRVLWQKNTATPKHFFVENISGVEETISIKKSYSGNPSVPIEISSDGQNWTTLGTTSTTALTFSLPVGSKRYLRANANSWGGNYIWGCSKVGGNIMSLLYGSNFTGDEVAFPGNYTEQFVNLFDSNTDLIDASELILPVTTLTQSCYYMMFYSCTSLTTSPKIMAKTLAQNSCNGMFWHCNALNDVTSYIDDRSAALSTQSWLADVATTGTFHKLGNATYPTGPSGIPSGWTVVNN